MAYEVFLVELLSNRENVRENEGEKRCGKEIYVLIDRTGGQLK
jgi:hypothetical protein